MLKSPPILILDEATSMLDSRTEAVVLHNLRQIAAGVASIVVAHRLSTVMRADDIVVLENGVVRERGSHAGLMSVEGAYARLPRE